MQIPRKVPAFISFNKDSDALIDVTDFSIYSEGVQICSAGDIVSALELYLAVLYVFNLEYPKGLTKTTMCLDRMLLGNEGKYNNPPKIIREAEKHINSVISRRNAV